MPEEVVDQSQSVPVESGSGEIVPTTEKKQVVTGGLVDSENGGRKVFNYKNKAKENRSSSAMKEIDKLKSDEILKDLNLGAKTCFLIDKLDFNEREKVVPLLKDTNNAENNGWIAVSTKSEDGQDPSKAVEEAIKAYRGLGKSNDESCVAAYGDVSFSVDFSKLNLTRNPEDDGVEFPYGVFFFSDINTPASKYHATVSVCGWATQKAANNKYYTPISDWTNVQVSGSFKRSGHFVVFYVDGTTEKNPGEFWPNITVIDIEVGCRKGEGGMVAATFIKKCFKKFTCTQDDIEFIINNVYGKYSPSVNTKYDASFIGSYVYFVGANPKNYNLYPEQSERTELEDKKGRFEIANPEGSFNRSRSQDKKSSKSGAKKQKVKKSKTPVADAAPSAEVPSEEKKADALDSALDAEVPTQEVADDKQESKEQDS